MLRRERVPLLERSEKIVVVIPDVNRHQPYCPIIANLPNVFFSIIIIIRRCCDA